MSFKKGDKVKVVKLNKGPSDWNRRQSYIRYYSNDRPVHAQGIVKDVNTCYRFGDRTYYVVELSNGTVYRYWPKELSKGDWQVDGKGNLI